MNSLYLNEDFQIYDGLQFLSNAFYSILTPQEDFFKLLVYDENPLDKDNLTRDQKQQLIYKRPQDEGVIGRDDDNPFTPRVHFKKWDNNVEPETNRQLNIYVDRLLSLDKQLGEVTVKVDLMCHDDTETMTDSSSRLMRMLPFIYSAFNGFTGIELASPVYAQNGVSINRFFYNTRYQGFPLEFVVKINSVRGICDAATKI